MSIIRMNKYGVRKYYADPDNPDADKELGIIYTQDYWEDNEGISIYPLDEKIRLYISIGSECKPL